MVPRSSIIMDLTIPARPLLPSRWPIFDLTDPLMTLLARVDVEHMIC